MGSHVRDNFLRFINYEDVIRTLSVLHITVVISPYPHEKEQAKFSLTNMLNMKTLTTWFVSQNPHEK